MEKCMTWLEKELQGMVLCDEIREKAKAMGFNRKQLKEARKELGVRCWHQFDKNGATSNWFWYIEGKNK